MHAESATKIRLTGSGTLAVILLPEPLLIAP
jgi:hypothetical protein